MLIPEDQVLNKKVIGKLKDSKVLQINTIGGLSLVVLAKGVNGETLGVASHPAIARYIASKRSPDIEWTELSKSEVVDSVHFQHLLPKYEALTEQFRNASKK